MEPFSSCLPSGCLLRASVSGKEGHEAARASRVADRLGRRPEMRRPRRISDSADLEGSKDLKVFKVLRALKEIRRNLPISGKNGRLFGATSPVPVATIRRIGEKSSLLLRPSRRPACGKPVFPAVFSLFRRVRNVKIFSLRRFREADGRSVSSRPVKRTAWRLLREGEMRHAVCVRQGTFPFAEVEGLISHCRSVRGIRRFAPR